MAKNDKRYWVYSHDSSGDLVSNIADESEYDDAVDAAVNWLRHAYPGLSSLVVRVVDNELHGGTTVWIAGPGNNVVSVEDAVSLNETV